MKILVTGGAGFIGSNFIRLIMKETAHRVVNFDLLTYAGNRSNCAEFEGGGRYEFIQGDIADRKALEGAVAGRSITAIVNFAAESHVDRSIHDASVFIRTNIAGTQALLEVAREHGVDRFVHISTDEVYGDLKETDPRFTESSAIRPSSPYSASKAAADMLVLAAHRTHGQPALITRSSNNYGPYQHPEKLIPLTIFRAKSGEPIPIYGKGTNIRDWIHVEDHCRGIIAAIERGIDGEIYNFGGASERRNIDVAKTILRLMGKREDLIRFVTDRPGHDLRYAIDFAKAEMELGWKPAIAFEDGIRSTIEWYESNRKWVAKSASGEFREFFKKHYGEIR